MIVIIDYHVGNLMSVQNAFLKLGMDVVVSRDHDVIRQAKGIVLPGVGTFPVAMEHLKQYDTEAYTQALKAIMDATKPEIALLGATTLGRDLAPRLSSRLSTGLTADCTKLDIDDERLSSTTSAEEYILDHVANDGNATAETFGVTRITNMADYLNMFSEQDKPIIAKMLRNGELKYACR